MNHHPCHSIRAALGAIAVLASSHFTFAQDPAPPPDPSIAFEGNWVMEFSNYPTKGKTDKQYITVARTWETWCNGKPFDSRGPVPPEGGNWTPHRVMKSPLTGTGGYGTAESKGAKLSAKHNYDFLGLWGGKSDVSMTGPNEVRGKWDYGKDSGGEEVWHRVFPRVTDVIWESKVTERVVFGEKTGRVETNYSGPDNGMRGNRAGFDIKVMGDNLWGHHICRIEGTDLEIKGVWPITEKGSGKPLDVTGILVRATIWSKASPGRKTLHVDDIKIPFELVVNGFPDSQKPAVPELRFVRLVKGKYEPAGELRHGDEFCVEARYNVKPPQAPGKVQLSWTDGQPREIDVKATDDGTLFRSAPLKLESPVTP